MCLASPQQTELPTTGNRHHADTEREIWDQMEASAWHNSVAKSGSIFLDTYKATRSQIEQVVEANGHDIVIEVGCGTGDVIGELQLGDDVPRLGLDINHKFIHHCKSTHEGCEFLVVDACFLNQWWKQYNHNGRFKKPLVTCVNNTLNIMPEEIRGKVVDQLLAVAGNQGGRCLVTYWNGIFFSHAVMGYYKTNKDLCGPFDIKKHVDWEARKLLTPSGYSTHWMYAAEVQKLLLATCDLDVAEIEDELKPDRDHINEDALAIFIWFSGKSSVGKQ